MRGDDDELVPPGRAFWLEVRGDERRVEERPLCPTCATALGLAVRRAIELEDDEG